MTAVGSARFFPFATRDNSISLGGNRVLDAVRGFFQSVRPGTGRVLVNTNATHGVFRSAVPLRDLFTAARIAVMNTEQRPHLRDLRTMSKLLSRTRVQYPMRDVNGKEYTAKKAILGLACRTDLRMSSMQYPPKFRGDKQFGGPFDVHFYIETPPPSTKIKQGYITVGEYYKLRKHFRPLLDLMHADGAIKVTTNRLTGACLLSMWARQRDQSLFPPIYAPSFPAKLSDRS
jgi:eukaryotic translation initiation factor 2C